MIVKYFKNQTYVRCVVAKIIGTGSYLPKNIVTNKDLEKVVDTSDDWIISRTGIRERAFATDENTGDLAYMASLKAIEDAGISPEEIGYIILGTITPQSLLGSTACYVQAKLGTVNATCFDINAACTGFVYGLEIAEGLLAISDRKYALVIGAEVLSKIVDFTDRTTCVLFGDGAGAAVLEKGDGIRSVVTGADGTKISALHSGEFKVRNFLAGNQVSDHFIIMEGREVFKFAVRVLPKALSEAVGKAGMKMSDLDHVIPHQANLRIIDAAAAKMELPREKFYVNLDRVGNTSAASIPIALDEMNRKGLLKKGDRLGLVGFGGGLTYGAAVIEWSK